MPTIVPNVTLNNGVTHADARLRRLPGPPGGDRSGGRDRARGRIPADRHRRFLRQRGGGRPGLAGSGIPRDELFITTKLWIQNPGEANARRAFEGSRGAARPRPPRPVPDPPAPRGLLQLLAGHGAGVRRGARPSDRRVQLPPRPARRPRSSTTRWSPAVNQIETHPFFQRRATRTSCAPTACRWRRGEVSPRAATTCSATRRSPPSARRTASRSPRSCSAGSSSATSSRSRSPSAGSAWSRTSTSSTSPSPTTRWPRSPSGRRLVVVLRPP